MKVELTKIIETREKQEVFIGSHIYLIILRITDKDRTQYVRRMLVFDYKGNPPYLHDAYSVEVMAVYEYRLTERETIPSYDVFGDKYLEPIL